MYEEAMDVAVRELGIGHAYTHLTRQNMAEVRVDCKTSSTHH
jgi:hypothetical protein